MSPIAKISSTDKVIKNFSDKAESAHFFKFVHSQGELEKAGFDLLVSKNIEKRRVYIDLQEEIIYSMNTQYGGNSLGLKKLAMRLAINRCSRRELACRTYASHGGSWTTWTNQLFYWCIPIDVRKNVYSDDER